jgi:hypothetical protein
LWEAITSGKSAINQLEIWREAAFDPAETGSELTWAAAMDMNYAAAERR